MSVERRQHERKSLRSSAQLVLPNQAPLEVRTVDLSVGGMGVVAAANLAPRLTCLVRVVVPLKPKGVTVIEAQAQVAHGVLSSSHAGFLVGLQFVGISAATAAAIKQFMQQ